MSDRNEHIEGLLNSALESARIRLLSESRAALLRLRRDYKLHENARVMAKVMLIEGVVATYSGDTKVALDRMLRGLEISKAARISEMICLLNAWLASAYFNAGELIRSVNRAKLVVTDSSDEDVDARARAYGMLGVSCEICGLDDLAKDWFSRSRALIQGESDRAMLSATILNMAIARLSRRRFGMVFDRVPSDSSSLELLFMRSSKSYDSGASVSVQMHYHGIFRG